MSVGKCRCMMCGAVQTIPNCCCKYCCCNCGCVGIACVCSLHQSMAEMLKRQDREGGRSRHWRSNFKRLQRELLQLEEDEHVLDSVFPQV